MSHIFERNLGDFNRNSGNSQPQAQPGAGLSLGPLARSSLVLGSLAGPELPGDVRSSALSPLLVLESSRVLVCIFSQVDGARTRYISNVLMLLRKMARRVSPTTSSSLIYTDTLFMFRVHLAHPYSRCNRKPPANSVPSASGTGARGRARRLSARRQRTVDGDAAMAETALKRERESQSD